MNIIELGNAWSRILKNGVELTRVYEQNLMDLYKPTKWFIEMSADGLIKVFSHHNQWAPLMTADTTPININYIAFASESRIKFFYEVNEALQPTAHPENIPTTIDTYVKHPLLKVIEYPIGLADFCKFLDFHNSQIRRESIVHYLPLYSLFSL